MKFINLFFPIIMSLSMSGTPTRIGGSDVYIVSDYIGPFYSDRDYHYSIDIYCLGEKDKLNIYYAYNHTGAVYCSETYKMDGYTFINGQAYKHFDLTLPTKYYLSNNGIRITYEIVRSRIVIYSREVVIYPKNTNLSVDGNLYRSSFYRIYNYIFKLDGLNNVINYESYCFSNIDRYIYTSKYDYVVIYENYLRFENEYLGTIWGENYLCIEDENNIFPYLPKIGNTVYMPLYLVKSTGRIYFVPRGPMYVNPFTLQISLTPRSGFIETDKFLLPLDYPDTIESYHMYYLFSDFGLSGVDLYCDINCINNYRFFGSCDSSTYCIGGGVVG